MSDTDTKQRRSCWSLSRSFVHILAVVSEEDHVIDKIAVSRTIIMMQQQSKAAELYRCGVTVDTSVELAPGLGRAGAGTQGNELARLFLPDMCGCSKW